jgi:hypothetical protein
MRLYVAATLFPEADGAFLAWVRALKTDGHDGDIPRATLRRACAGPMGRRG